MWNSLQISKTFFYSKLSVIVDHCELDKNKKKKNKKKGNSKPDDGIERRVRFLSQFWTRFAWKFDDFWLFVGLDMRFECQFCVCFTSVTKPTESGIRKPNLRSSTATKRAQLNGTRPHDRRTFSISYPDSAQIKSKSWFNFRTSIFSPFDGD